MRLVRALVYFLAEALVSLRRGWSIGLLAVLTIGTSLFVLGLFLLVSHNLDGLVEQWRTEARVIVYLDQQISEQAMADLRQRVAARPGVRVVSLIDAAEASERFARLFPSLRGALGDPGEPALPASLEVRPQPGAAEAVVHWLRGLGEESGVAMVDDDRDWLAQLDAFVGFLRFAGLTFGGVLLAAAVFTIAAVIRLAFHLYRDEVSVMRLVGATELYVRGPFYCSGVLQGLLGSLIGITCLYAAYRVLAPEVPLSIFAAVLEGGFLPPSRLLLLALVGAAAGLLGAVVSLRREREA